MAKTKRVYCCSECGNETPVWYGQCRACGSWDTLKEIIIDSPSKSAPSYAKASINASRNKAKTINELNSESEIRFSTGISEFDRVLGGGAVCGSLILVGGAPGIGKSTILLQMCRSIDPDKKILYVSGEESERQIKLRADRLQVRNDHLYVLSETDISSVISTASDLEPDLMIIDSIQTVSDYSSESVPGSVSQVRECTTKIMRYAKESNVTTFIVGHINKEGSIAGPKVLEHMVDCVLYFEGESSTSFRLLRGAKNRFGSTNEIGVFEMTDTGLNCIENPSESLLAGRPENCPGTCVTCILEGTRPILAEVQALVAQTQYNPSRKSNGLDYNRACMLVAVTEKRGGIAVSGCDTYINVIGGLTLDEPAADLATVLAVASSYLDRPLGEDLVAIGEVGLSGEVRSVTSINQRLSEISRLGFKRCLIPAHIKDDLKKYPGLETIPVKNIYEAIRIAAKKQ